MYEIGIFAAGFAAGLLFCVSVFHRRIRRGLARLQKDLDVSGF